jgi:hypothetical protein
MEVCEARTGGVCRRTATWKQAIHAGQRDQGRVLLHAARCDEHAERVVQKRRRESLPPPRMTRLAVETA